LLVLSGLTIASALLAPETNRVSIDGRARENIADRVRAGDEAAAHSWANDVRAGVRRGS
jgi:hypothetical protein